MLLYKFRPLRSDARFYEQDLDRLKDIVVNEKLYCASTECLNDPFEGILGFQPQAEKEHRGPADVEFLKALGAEWERHMESIRGQRVASLSASYHNILMWSHYAAGGQGVCIEMDIPEGTEGLNEVQYVDTVEELERVDESAHLLRKLKDWSYEDEWRIIQPQKWFSVSGCVKRIIMGGRITKAGIRFVEETVIEREYGVAIASATTNGFLRIK